MHIYLTPNTIIESISLAIGVFCLLKDKKHQWRLMVWYLLLGLLTEIAGIYLWKVKGGSNASLYNYYVFVENGMISYFFYTLIEPFRNVKGWFLGWMLLFSCGYLFELNVSEEFVFRTVAGMSIVFVLCSLYYFYLILEDDTFRNLVQYPPFWWVSGILFFYFGGTVCNLFFEYFLVNQRFITVKVRYLIFHFLIFFLYTCWSIAFICRYRQRLLPH